MYLTTYTACLTPPGSGAIAIVAVRGEDAWRIVRKLFRPIKTPEATLPEKVQSQQFWLGKLTGDVADEVVVVARRLQPVPDIEIHSHGGRQVVELILDTLGKH